MDLSHMSLIENETHFFVQFKNLALVSTPKKKKF